MRLFAIMLALLSLQWFEGRVLVSADVATATSYGPPYTPTKCNGNREDQFPPNNMFAAVCDGLWNNGAACGRKYMVRCLSGSNRPCKEGVSIVVEVVDKCSQNPCPANLLLSGDAFDAISQSTSGKINVEYIQI
ncbi:EG45-like domain containing protein [Ananas comosus]|uniref:EG45-like domain containing protein n=1 Tax=Ananas comosus TaxID=4615 RepID=A0A6P5F6Y0_ANACO|nr:EG45-like domain containing protein [Ananas comosus]